MLGLLGDRPLGSLSVRGGGTLRRGRAGGDGARGEVGGGRGLGAAKRRVAAGRGPPGAYLPRARRGLSPRQLCCVGILARKSQLIAAGPLGVFGQSARAASCPGVLRGGA